MKKILFFLSLGFCFSGSAWAKTSCFLASENDRILKKEGPCGARYAVCSTFKIAISLMGYDAGLLVDTGSPELPFEEGFADDLEVWKRPHNPSLWMQNSCVWFTGHNSEAWKRKIQRVRQKIQLWKPRYLRESAKRKWLDAFMAHKFFTDFA